MRSQLVRWASIPCRRCRPLPIWSTTLFPLPLQGGRRLANPPPFSLQDLRDAIPAECFEKDTFRSFGALSAALHALHIPAIHTHSPAGVH